MYLYPTDEHLSFISPYVQYGRHTEANKQSPLSKERRPQESIEKGIAPCVQRANMASSVSIIN